MTLSSTSGGCSHYRCDTTFRCWWLFPLQVWHYLPLLVAAPITGVTLLFAAGGCSHYRGKHFDIFTHYPHLKMKMRRYNLKLKHIMQCSQFSSCKGPPCYFSINTTPLSMHLTGFPVRFRFIRKPRYLALTSVVSACWLAPVSGQAPHPGLHTETMHQRQYLAPSTAMENFFILIVLRTYSLLQYYRVKWRQDLYIGT
jgi:hypothetical protein